MRLVRSSIRLFCAACLSSVILLMIIPGVAFSADKVALNLDECIRQAVEINSEVKGAEFEVEVYRSKKEQADSARYAQGEIIAYGSLSPRARLLQGGDGSVLSSTNINQSHYDGVFGNATIQLIQPLYTFGKISGYREAAGHGILAYEAGAKLKATEVAQLVKEAYYGLLLGRELKGLLLDIRDQLDRATDKVEKQLDAGAPNVDQVDLFKMRTYQGELERYMAQADEGIAKATYGLRLLTGHMDEREEFDIADQFLDPAEVKMEDFDMYVGKAMQGRLEFTQLREGLIAKDDLIKVEQAEYYPQVFLLGFYSVAGATNRDHLNNPYIFDDFNHNTGGVVLGFKLSLDFGIKCGKVNEARAEYLKLKMKEEYAMGGVPFQVKDSYLQLARSMEEMKALESAYKNSKQWVVASLSNFDMGVGEARDIADSVSAYARLRADYFRAVYNQRMALANLEHATGMDVQQVPYKVRSYNLKDTKNAADKMGGM